MSQQYKKTIVLGLDYSDFSGGITECNRKMGLLDAEFARATEEAKLYGTETDQLRLKHDMLTQKIALQKQKVMEAEAAYNKAADANKEGSKAVDAADKALLNQRTTLLKLESQLKDTNKQYDKVQKTNESFGDSIRNVADAIGIKASPALENFASKFDGVNQDVGAAVIVVGGLAAAYADLAIELSKTADNLLTLSSTTGLSTETLQELQYASEFVDVSVDTLSSSMTKMIRSMADARDGNEDLQKTFARLGVRYKESNGELRDAEKVFYDLIDALGKTRNETERDAKSMDIFGKSARDLNPLIEAGSKRLKELGDEAHRVGYVLDDETLESAGRLDDAMQSMNRKFEAVKLELGTYLIPVLETFADLLSGIPTPVLIGIATFGTMIMVLGSVAKAVIALSTANNIAAASNMLLGTTGAAATAGMGPLLLILLGIAAAIALIVGGTAAVGKAMDEVKSSTEGIISSSQSAKKPKYNASGTEYFEGGETWVGESGPEKVILPRGSKIINAQDSKKATQVNNYYVTIDAKSVREFNDVVRLAQREQVSYRAGRVKA